jgi:hypothetical protein
MMRTPAMDHGGHLRSDRIMKRLGSIGWAYVLTLTPMLFGSITFFWWFYARRWYAIDVKIELTAFAAIILYFIGGTIALGFCLDAWVKNKSSWRRVLGPLFVIAFTWVLIDLYGEHHRRDDRAYLRVDVRNSDVTEVLLWSSHFETGLRRNASKEELVFAFEPVYTYGWGIKTSSGYSHQVDSVFIEVHEHAVIKTFVLPTMRKRACRTLNEEELRQLPVARNRTRVYRQTEI